MYDFCQLKTLREYLKKSAKEKKKIRENYIVQVS